VGAATRPRDLREVGRVEDEVSVALLELLLAQELAPVELAALHVGVVRHVRHGLGIVVLMCVLDGRQVCLIGIWATSEVMGDIATVVVIFIYKPQGAVGLVVDGAGCSRQVTRWFSSIWTWVRIEVEVEVSAGGHSIEAGQEQVDLVLDVEHETAELGRYRRRRRVPADPRSERPQRHGMDGRVLGLGEAGGPPAEGDVALGLVGQHVHEVED
jgi:hypothetical protein